MTDHRQSSNGSGWPATYARVVLASRPQGLPRAENFRVEWVGAPELAEGQVRVRNHYLSIDPYMVGRMYDTVSYAPSNAVGDVMPGETAGQVVESRHADFAVGQFVVGPLGWQEQAVSNGERLRCVDPARAPLSAYLGVLGMTGVTAWYGLTQICQPRAGSTVVVSAAAGAVGGTALQLAKARGCRVVGIAGGEHKCQYVIQVLGADACVDYKPFSDSKALGEALAQVAPEGFDACFDNVNGWVLDAILPRMNLFGRIALCGMIARYGQAPNQLTAHGHLLISRLRAQGFIVWDHIDMWQQAVDEFGALMDSGDLRYQETVAQGIAAAPGACIGLLAGQNTGKQIVNLIDDPSINH